MALRRDCADEALAQAMMARSTPGKPDECWEWTGNRLASGYGRFSFRGEATTVHRLSYRAFIGPIPDGASICHRCDNRPCWNPAHLFAGSTADNIKDCVEKRRNAHGERHYAAKLTEDDVRLIREAYAAGVDGTFLARRYGVSPFTVYKLLNGRSWKHVA